MQEPQQNQNTLEISQNQNLPNPSGESQNQNPPEETKVFIPPTITPQLNIIENTENTAQTQIISNNINQNNENQNNYSNKIIIENENISFEKPQNIPVINLITDNASNSNDISSYTPNQSTKKLKKNNKEIICTVEGCSKIFYDRGAFRKHQLTHGEKLFSCKICNKKFLDNSKLRRHSLVHSGEKPFACPYCPKKFSLDFNLRTHMRIHSGEKPYACIYPGCFKRFSQSSNLSAHEKTHELLKKDAGIIEELNSRPIFAENPLKYIIDNPYSGTETMNNVQKINELYELMKKGMLSMNNNSNINNLNNIRNSNDLQGMPHQKRMYIKKADREFLSNLNDPTKINNREKETDSITKQNKKVFFQTSLSDKNNNEENNLIGKKRKIFAIHRDPPTNNNYFGNETKEENYEQFNGNNEYLYENCDNNEKINLDEQQDNYEIYDIEDDKECETFRKYLEK